MSRTALEGLRVVDLTWVIAGPFCNKLLADMGAEIIKVESRHKVDGLRMEGPWKDNIPTGPNRSGLFDTMNVNKLSFLLNLRVAAGLDIFKRLVEASDVVIENFSSGTMEKFGLGYPVLSEVNPRIVMIRLSGYGQTGPYSNYISFGPTLQAISGLTYITGHPGRTPVGIGQAYPDYTGGLFAALAILSGIRQCRRTGKGQCIDLSQYEGAVCVLGHTLLDYTVNGRIPEATGNRHPYACPHGCYRCKGDDRWCAIAVYNDKEWQAFCHVLGNPAWTSDPAFATFLGRKKREDELDRLIEEWTIERSAEEVMESIQSAGVPAGVVQNVKDLITDDCHMKAREYYQEMEHPPIGKIVPEGIPFKLLGTPGSLRTPAPLLGEHNDYILKSILGMSQEEIDKFASQGAFK
ncbi:MAG: CoA transferase [Dehalococcoidia bacterium]|nr:CoA transferase [Dehalococcoidia bacterium]